MENTEQWIRMFYQSDCGCSLDNLCGRYFWRNFLKGCIWQEELDELFGVPPFWAFLFCGEAGTGKSTLALTYLGELENQGYQLIYLRAEELLENKSEAKRRVEQLKKECIRWEKTVICLENAEVLKEENGIASLLADSIAFLKRNNVIGIWILIAENEEDIPAVLRNELYPCRLELPVQEEREEYFRLTLEDMRKETASFSVVRAAELTEGYTFRQLWQTVVFYKALLKQKLLDEYKGDWMAVRQLAEAGELILRKELFCQAAEKAGKKISDPQKLSSKQSEMESLLTQVLRTGILFSEKREDATLFRDEQPAGTARLLKEENDLFPYKNSKDAKECSETEEDENWLELELDELDPSTLD